jgi:hypothetical protein
VSCCVPRARHASAFDAGGCSGSGILPATADRQRERPHADLRDVVKANGGAARPKHASDALPRARVGNGRKARDVGG